MGFSSYGSGLSKHTSVSQPNRVFPANLFVPGLDVGLGADQQPRTRLMAGFMQLGAGGSSALDTEVVRLPPVGVSTAGRPGAGGRHFERLGWLNVKDYGALGDNATNDKAAIAAAIAAVPANGGVVYFPPGIYMVDCTTAAGVLLPNLKDIHLVGNSDGITVNQANTQIRRQAGTNPVIANVNTVGEGFKGCIRNLDIHGNTLVGNIITITRAGSARFRNLRITNGTGTSTGTHGAIFRALWNCAFENVHFHAMGNGASNASTLFSDVAGEANSNCNTIHLTDCEWEHNFGTDIYFSGSDTPSRGIIVVNCKFERGKAPTNGSTWPFVRFGYQWGCKIIGGFMTAMGESPATCIVTDHASGRGAGVIGMDLEHGTAPTTPTHYIIDQQQGTLSVAGCNFDNWASSIATAWRIGSAVPIYGAAGSGNVYHTLTQASHTSGKRYIDNRTGTGLPQGPVGVSTQFV